MEAYGIYQGNPALKISNKKYYIIKHQHYESFNYHFLLQPGSHHSWSNRSVLEQDYPYIEYIVVDGASKDNSLAVINEYKTG